MGLYLINGVCISEALVARAGMGSYSFLYRLYSLDFKQAGRREISFEKLAIL